MATPTSLASLKLQAKKSLWSVLYNIAADPAGPAAPSASHGMHRKIPSCAPDGEIRDSECVWFSQVMESAGRAQGQCTLVRQQTLAFLSSAIPIRCFSFPRPLWILTVQKRPKGEISFLQWILENRLEATSLLFPQDLIVCQFISANSPSNTIILKQGVEKVYNPSDESKNKDYMHVIRKGLQEGDFEACGFGRRFHHLR